MGVVLNYNSSYLTFANQELDWLPMDTRELYEKNLSNNYSLLEKNNWINFKFTYKFNSLGFRSEEFSNDPSIMFLGCSNTCGIGLPIEYMWSTIVAQELNLKNFNLGIGGSSPDTAFRLCHGYIKKINPKIIIYLEPPSGRLELIISKNEILSYTVSTVNEYLNPPIKIFYETWIKEETNDILNYEKNYRGIKSLCEENKIKFLGFKSDFFYQFGQKGDFARDLAHSGKNTNSNFANYILKHID